VAVIEVEVTVALLVSVSDSEPALNILIPALIALQPDRRTAENVTARTPRPIWQIFDSFLHI